MIESRTGKILGELEKRDLCAFLFVSKGRQGQDMLYYLTGFRGFGGVVCWTRDGGHLFVHPMDAAKAADDSFCQSAGDEEPLQRACELVAAADCVGFDPTSISVREYETIIGCLEEGHLRDAADFTTHLALYKEPWEQDLLREAGRVVTRAVEETFSSLREGMSELDAARELGARIYQNRGEDIAFLLVAFGENAAYPHHLPSQERHLRHGDFVLIDCGAHVGGYASDITRTAVWGEPTERQKRLYDLAWRAQQEALDRLRVGVTAGDVDAAARRVIEDAGMGDRFIHSLGHGLGFTPLPQLRRGDRMPLEEGMTFTVEPGIYIPGFGGVRIEDDVLFTREGPDLLTGARSETLISLPR